MNEVSFPNFSCRHYDRNDWLKVDVNALLAPWVNRVAEVYKIAKTPAKYIVTYALAMLAVPHTQEIMNVVWAILDDPATFQRRYGTQLKVKERGTSILANPHGYQSAVPRQVNFMDLVDYWATPINRTFGIGIVQCRDVVKIALAFYLSDHAHLLAQAIQELAQSQDGELFSEGGKIVFPELEIEGPD